MVILAQQFPVYQPAMRIVTNITNAAQAVVTTSFNHQYIIGTIVRLHLPKGWGMRQINNEFGTILSVTPTTFTLDIDSSTYDPFTTPGAYPDNTQYAQVTAIGEDNAILTAAERNVLPY